MRSHFYYTGCNPSTLPEIRRYHVVFLPNCFGHGTLVLLYLEDGVSWAFACEQ
jgi:hypothetical protein